MGNEIFEEIKKKYKKSNKYMLCVSYEDIGILIQIIEKQQKEIEELKEEKGYHLGFIDGGIAKRYEMENKIKARIEELDKDENASIPDFIEYAKEYATQKLQSLLEKE